METRARFEAEAEADKALKDEKNNASTYMWNSLCVLLVADHIQGGVLQGCAREKFVHAVCGRFASQISIYVATLVEGTKMT